MYAAIPQDLRALALGFLLFRAQKAYFQIKVSLRRRLMAALRSSLV
jgi:hypothetical protein